MKQIVYLTGVVFLLVIFIPGLSLFADPLPIINGDFELGQDGSWTVTSTNALQDYIITNLSDYGIPNHDGNYSAWLGGDPGETSTISQPITIPGNATLLSYWYWIDSNDSCGKSNGSVYLNTTLLKTYDLCHVTVGWVNEKIDISAYRGLKRDLIFKAQSASDPSGTYISSLLIDSISLQVGSSGPLDHFEFSAISSPQTVGVPFSVTITVKDANGNTVTDFNGFATLVSTIGVVSPPSISLTSGTGNGNISIDTIGNNIYITASANGKQGQTNAFNVQMQGKNYVFLPVISKPEPAPPPPIIPNDSYYQNQWGLAKIDAPNAWSISKGEGVIIAIIDTGVDLNHPDIFSKIVPGYDFVNNDHNPQDNNGHGPHVAGIAAAMTNNETGISGLGWNAQIMPVKVLSANGSGYSTGVANGIVWAVNTGAKIINLSLGSMNSSTTILNAINYAYNNGALVIAAAGNCGDPNTYFINNCTSLNPVMYPAAYSNVLGVGAIDANDAKADFSNSGSYIDVVAPGVSIFSTVWNDSYASKSGTSMATPFVSGLAALVWAKNPSLTNHQVGDIIVGTADDLGPIGRDNFFGYGRINAAKAVAGATSKSSFQVEEKPLRPEIAFDSNSQFEPGTVLVGLKKSLNLAEKIGVLNQFNLDVIETIELLDILKLKVEPGTEISNINRLRKNPSVEFAEPNFLIHLIE